MDGKLLKNVKGTYCDLLSSMINFFYLSHFCLIYFFMQKKILPSEHKYYQWPIRVFNHFSVENISKTIIFFSLFAYIITIFQWKKKWCRILIFIANSLVLSLFNIENFNSNHAMYIYMIISFYLIWRDENQDQEKNAQHFFKLKLLIALPYFLSGMQKIISLGYDFFDLNILNKLMAKRFFESGESLIFPHIVSINTFTFPSYQFIALIQIAGIFIANNRRFYKAWALTMILFHIATYLILDVFFITNILVLLIFNFTHLSENSSVLNEAKI